MGTLAIIISLALLMFFAYRGISVLILAPIMAAVAILLSGDMAYMMPQYGFGRLYFKILSYFFIGCLIWAAHG